MIRFFMLCMIGVLLSAVAQARYSTKDNNDTDCVPVEATTAPDVDYHAKAPDWNETTIAPSGVQARDGGNVAMHLRVPPSRINNKAFQNQLGASEIHVGTYLKNGAQEDLSILGEDIPTGSTHYCK